MPEGPKGEKRPAGVIGNAVRIMRIVIGPYKMTSDNFPVNPFSEQDQ